MSTDLRMEPPIQATGETEKLREGSKERKAEPSLPVKTKVRVGYILSRFPKLTETFILFEMIGVEKQGIDIELFPLLRVKESAIHPEGASIWKKLLERLSPANGKILMHPEAVRFVERAHYLPFFSWPIFKAQIHTLLRRPGKYFGALWALVRSNWGSSNYLAGALSIFPKTVLIAKWMEENSIDHVHAHFANHPAAAAFIIHQLTGIPYSFTAHGADLQVDQHMLIEKVRDAAFVVTISNYNQNFILEKCGEQYRDKVVVIHCGVDTQHFNPGDLSDKDGIFKILCIGTLYEVKGQTYLIEACQILKEKGIAFRCDLVGDGPFRQKLEQQVLEFGLKNEVIFHGQQTRQRISEMLNQANVLVVPSIPTSSGRREGIPVVLMEAMSSAVAVVASGISGIPELVEDGVGGILVPPRDPEALARALQSLSIDPKLGRRLGKAGRKKVLAEFDLEKNAAELTDRFQGGQS